MNEKINKFLLEGDKLIPAKHLRLPGFTYSTCGPLQKTIKEYKSLKKHEIQDIFLKTN